MVFTGRSSSTQRTTVLHLQIAYVFLCNHHTRTLLTLEITEEIAEVSLIENFLYFFLAEFNICYAWHHISAYISLI